METERRYINADFEIRKASDGLVIEGHAAVFNRHSQNLGGFVEQVAPGAFTKTLAEADVRALFNHDKNLVLGRTRAGTLELSEDNVGLSYRVTLPDTSFGRDLAVSVERGDISQSSFGFQTMKDDWSFTPEDFPLRTLQEVRLIDVSAVTYPAYLDAEVGVGRALEHLAEARGWDLDTVRADIPAAIRGDVLCAEEPGAPTPRRNLARYRVELAGKQARWSR